MPAAMVPCTVLSRREPRECASINGLHTRPPGPEETTCFVLGVRLTTSWLQMVSARSADHMPCYGHQQILSFLWNISKDCGLTRVMNKASRIMLSRDNNMAIHHIHSRLSITPQTQLPRLHRNCNLTRQILSNSRSSCGVVDVKYRKSPFSKANFGEVVPDDSCR